MAKRYQSLVDYLMMLPPEKLRSVLLNKLSSDEAWREAIRQDKKAFQAQQRHLSEKEKQKLIDQWVFEACEYFRQTDPDLAYRMGDYYLEDFEGDFQNDFESAIKNRVQTTKLAAHHALLITFVDHFLEAAIRLVDTDCCPDLPAGLASFALDTIEKLIHNASATVKREIKEELKNILSCDHYYEMPSYYFQQLAQLFNDLDADTEL